MRLDQQRQSVCYALHVSCYVAMHCDTRKLALVLQPSLARRSGAKKLSKSTTNYRGKSEYFDLNLFCINMPQMFTFNRGSLCSSVKIGNRLRCGRPNDRCSIPGSTRLLCSNPSYTRSDPGTI